MTRIHTAGTWTGGHPTLDAPEVAGFKEGQRLEITLDVPIPDDELAKQAAGLRSVFDAIGPQGIEIVEEENTAADAPRSPFPDL